MSYNSPGRQFYGIANLVNVYSGTVLHNQTATHSGLDRPRTFDGIGPR